jgi:putative aldouronate transport system permease protein
VTDVIDTYIYRGLINIGNVGMSTAAGLYQSAVGLILVLLVNKAVTKIDPESAMF